MKRVLFFLLLSASVMTASAQVSFGVKGGLNTTQLTFEKGEIYDVEQKAGFFIGPTAKLPLPILGLGLDASVLYDQRNAKQGTSICWIRLESLHRESLTTNVIQK